MGAFKDDVEVYDPVNTNKNVYYSKVMYKHAEISLQINKGSIILNKEKQKAKLVVDESTAEFMREISAAIVEITSEKSEHFFGKKINSEDCESIYKEALVKDNILHCFYDDDTYFYKTKNTQVSIEDIPTELEGIALLKCSAVVYTKNSFFIRWEVSQFKLKKPKILEEPYYMKEYIIKDLPEHSNPLDGDPLFKKIDEICLF
tara:strand:- start:2946 stop:3554 length:609 start_codon:yes stop_codon:yes gene_type:complete